MEGRKRGKKSKNGVRRSNGKFVLTNMEILESDDEVTLMADVPGADTGSLSVTVQKGVLTLSGKLDLGDQAKPRFRECEFGDFIRVFRIPSTVPRDHVKATVEDGILKVKIPKWEEREESRGYVDMQEYW